ncbi:MAG: hypothetical protein O9972_08790 [Burkholderiales bacterium]|jgi:hypothetical protein|nr:hypothetical protein [Burkholderiales bacterium]
MDATRVMTTAALAVAMASTFAPPVVGLMTSSPSHPSRGPEASAVASDVAGASPTKRRSLVAPSCEPAAPKLAARAPRLPETGT